MRGSGGFSTRRQSQNAVGELLRHLDLIDDHGNERQRRSTCFINRSKYTIALLILFSVTYFANIYSEFLFPQVVKHSSDSIVQNQISTPTTPAKRRKNIPKRLTLLHVGKCGGSTVKQEFRKSKIKFDEIHVQKKFAWKSNAHYLIIIRNPIRRFVSAFNWRLHLVVDTENQRTRFKHEYDFLKQYPTANDLAEALYNDNGIQQINFTTPSQYVHHLREDIHFYLKTLTPKDRDTIFAVIATETINEDMKRLFDIEVTKQAKNNQGRNYSKHLSTKAKKNLRRYYDQDFLDIDMLRDLGVLTEHQYEKLTKIKQRF